MIFNNATELDICFFSISFSAYCSCALFFALSLSLLHHFWWDSSLSMSENTFSFETLLGTNTDENLNEATRMIETISMTVYVYSVILWNSLYWTYPISSIHCTVHSKVRGAQKGSYKRSSSSFVVIDFSLKGGKTVAHTDQYIYGWKWDTVSQTVPFSYTSCSHPYAEWNLRLLPCNRTNERTKKKIIINEFLLCNKSFISSLLIFSSPTISYSVIFFKKLCIFLAKINLQKYNVLLLINFVHSNLPWFSFRSSTN